MVDNSEMAGHMDVERPLKVVTAKWGRRALAGASGVTFVALAVSMLGSTTPSSFVAAAPGSTHVSMARASSFSVVPGASVRVSGSGFKPRGAVAVAARWEPQGEVSRVAANRSGSLSALLTVPAGARSGWKTVVLSGTAPNGQALVEQVGVDVHSSATAAAAAPGQRD